MPQKHALNSDSEASYTPVAKRIFDEDERTVEENEGWMISYVDVLTLLLTLFVMLLALKGSNSADDAEVHRQAMPPATFKLGIPGPEAALTTSSSSTVSHDAHSVPPSLTEQAINAARAVVKALTPASVEKLPAIADKSGPQHEGILPAHASIRPMIDGVMVSQTPQGLTFRIQDRLLFASGEADLTAPGRDVLRSLLPTLKRLPGRISVEGHTDSQPIATQRFPSNWELSSARATAVLRYIEGEGIKDRRLRAIGYADTQPLGDNTTDAGRAKNRRVELVVHSQPDEDVKPEDTAGLARKLPQGLEEGTAR